MHELSVCTALLEQVERIAREQNALSVCRIVLRLGPLSGIEPALLRHAYPLAAAGTIAEHAELRIDASEVVVRCTRCGEESTVPPNRLLCQACGDFRTHLVSGDELLLQSVELTPVPHRSAAPG
jgi:hydrogenase nickel incorporation protein HypA/HybF